MAAYFALTVWYAIANENYITVPFLFLFVFGYWYTGLMSLLQGRFDSLVRERAEEAQRQTVSGGRVGSPAAELDGRACPAIRG